MGNGTSLELCCTQLDGDIILSVHRETREVYLRLLRFSQEFGTADNKVLLRKVRLLWNKRYIALNGFNSILPKSDFNCPCSCPKEVYLDLYYSYFQRYSYFLFKSLISSLC